MRVDEVCSRQGSPCFIGIRIDDNAVAGLLQMW